jgi:hypothetical protein
MLAAPAGRTPGIRTVTVVLLMRRAGLRGLPGVKRPRPKHQPPYAAYPT